MQTMVPAQEIKRRGISALNESLASGPVWVVSNNKPKYVVMFAEDFKRMRHEMFVADTLRSVEEYKAGLATKTTAKELMAEVLADLDSECED